MAAIPMDLQLPTPITGRMSLDLESLVWVQVDTRVDDRDQAVWHQTLQYTRFKEGEYGSQAGNH
jgi:hypothetical protein